MSTGDIIELVLLPVGAIALQIALRFILLRFMSRKASALLAGIGTIGLGLFAGEFAFFIVPACALVLLAQMAREPPKEDA